jgi:hypothetical protein
MEAPSAANAHARHARLNIKRRSIIIFCIYFDSRMGSHCIEINNTKRDFLFSFIWKMEGCKIPNEGKLTNLVFVIV